MTAAVQHKAPDFTADAVVDGEFKQVSLKDFEGKFLVLFFYPLDFTFVCPTEIIAFADRAEEFKKLGAELVGVSVDSKFSHHAWLNTPVQRVVSRVSTSPSSRTSTRPFPATTASC